MLSQKAKEIGIFLNLGAQGYKKSGDRKSKDKKPCAIRC
jgi:hypothetical protein